MVEENISQDFRLKNIDEAKNHFVKEIEQTKLVNKKCEIICTILTYTEHLLILVSTVIGCISISAFASLLGIPIGITSSAIGLKICTTTLGIEMYKSINKISKKKHDKIVLLANTKQNSVEV